MEVLITLVAPYLVRWLVSLAKKAQGFLAELDPSVRTTVLRTLAALFSYFAVISNAALTQGDFDPVAAQTLAETFIVFLATTGTYLTSKVKKSQVQ